jgi:sugar porter (SP) family MFS transporter
VTFDTGPAFPIRSFRDIPAMTSTTRQSFSRTPLWIAFVAAIGGFLFGFDLGLIGAANVYLEDQFSLTEAELGFATASAVLGCIIGPFFGSWMCDAIGRKKTMIIAALLLAVSAVFTAVPDVFSDGSPAGVMRSFNFFRFVGGVGVGLCSIASPMYIAELAPPARRGRLGLMYQLAVVLGHAVAPLIAWGIVAHLRINHGVLQGDIPAAWSLQAWRWMFLSEMASVVVFVGFVFGLPESPRWLARKGRYDEAEDVLRQIDGPAFARAEMEEIRGTMHADQGSWSDLLTPGMLWALFIGIALAFFNNWTGWSVIGGYIPRLFEAAGYQREDAIRDFVFVYGAMGLLTLVSISLADRVGRRPLWMFASVLAALITLLCGFVFAWGWKGTPVVIVIALITLPHGLALGGLPWLMMSELFPTRLRAKAVAVTTTVLWIFIFTGAYLFPSISRWSEEAVGSVAAAFWLFTGVCILSFFFGWLVMPETKGRTLEDIGESWNAGADRRLRDGSR